MKEKYTISDTLQQLIDWGRIMKMPRYAGGHDEQMQGLFKDAKVIGHYNEGDYQGMVATCVQLPDGRFVIYNDYYGSCSGCDSWDGASDEEIKSLCINLANGAYIFKSLRDVKEYLQGIDNNSSCFHWRDCAKPLLKRVNAYDFRRSLERMGFRHVIDNEDSMALLTHGFLIEITTSNENPNVATVSISQFDGEHRWTRCIQNVTMPDMPNRVIDFDIIEHVMKIIDSLLSHVLKEVSNKIKSTLTSNSREAIKTASKTQ
jgi:hypothetical protein